MDEYKKEIFQWLSENEKRTTYAREIHDLYDDYVMYLKQLLIEKFNSELKIRVKQSLGETWLVTQDKDIFKKHQAFNVSKRGWNNQYIIALSSESDNFSEIYYGLRSWHEPTIKEEEKKLQKNITEKFGKSKSEEDDTFIWWDHVAMGYDISGPIDNLCRLIEQNSNPFIESWINQLIALATFVEPYINKLIS